MQKDVLMAMFFILDSLRNLRIWGGKHTELRNLTKGLPMWLTSSRQGQRIIDKAIHKLGNLRFILAKKSTGQIHCSLNPRRVKDISFFLDNIAKLIEKEELGDNCSAENILAEIQKHLENI